MKRASNLASGFTCRRVLHADGLSELRNKNCLYTTQYQCNLAYSYDHITHRVGFWYRYHFKKYRPYCTSSFRYSLMIRTMRRGYQNCIMKIVVISFCFNVFYPFLIITHRVGYSYRYHFKKYRIVPLHSGTLNDTNHADGLLELRNKNCLHTTWYLCILSYSYRVG